MALEEYIKQVKETWTSYTLDLVNYQNKCRLIRYPYSLLCLVWN
jgi:dynein heavy chain 1